MKWNKSSVDIVVILITYLTILILLSTGLILYLFLGYFLAFLIIFFTPYQFKFHYLGIAITLFLILIDLFNKITGNGGQ